MLLQDQAALLDELHKAELVNNIHDIAMAGLASVLILGCALLMARTAMGLVNSRFLKHLAIALTINAFNTLVSCVYVLLRAALAYTALGAAKSTPQLPDSFHQQLLMLETVFDGISLSISILSNFFLFAAWDLLRRYPKQGVGKTLYIALTAVFGSGGLLIVLASVVVIIEKTQGHFWLILKSIDLVSSAVAILLVGWQLQKKLGPMLKEWIWRVTLPWITFMAYFAWGVPQLLHDVVRWQFWYSILIFLSGFAAAILTIILSSKALAEKSDYSSSPPPIQTVP